MAIDWAPCKSDSDDAVSDAFRRAMNGIKAKMGAMVVCRESEDLLGGEDLQRCFISLSRADGPDVWSKSAGSSLLFRISNSHLSHVLDNGTSH